MLMSLINLYVLDQVQVFGRYPWLLAHIEAKRFTILFVKISYDAPVLSGVSDLEQVAMKDRGVWNYR